VDVHGSPDGDAFYLFLPYVRLLDGDYPCAILLTQIDILFHSEADTVDRDGRQWVVMSEQGWERMIGIKESALNRCINKLRKRRLIETQRWQVQGAPTNHFWLDVPELRRQLHEGVRNG